MESIFEKVGKRHGYEDVKAEFTPFKDFKVKWMRSYKWINFDVSDYLKDAPAEVLEGVADTLFRKIKNEDATYPDVVYDYLTSAEFIEKNQRRFIQRNRGTTEDDGALKGAHDRLVASGIIENDPDIVFMWGTTASHKVGHSSVLMKVVILNDRLKGADMDVLDYAVYSQVVFVGLGFNATGENRGDRYNDLLDKYPNRSEMEEALEDVNLSI